jgi:hypothetical protein
MGANPVNVFWFLFLGGSDRSKTKISALMWGKLDGFSLDPLFRFLNALGRDVEIVIRPARQAGDADTRVVSA